MPRTVRCAALCLLLLVGASGCQSVKVAYYFLDNVIERQVEPYLYDSATKRLAAKQIDLFKAWLKRGLMPGAAAALDRVARPLARGTLDKKSFSRWYGSLDGLWKRAARRISQDVAVVLAQHNSLSQIAHMRAAMIKRQRERLKKMRRPRRERLRERTKGTVKGFERFSGSFEKRQWRVVWLHLEPLLEKPGFWLRNTRRRRRTLVFYLMQKPKRAALARFIEHMITRPQDFSEPGYAAHSKRVAAGYRDLLYAVVASMNSKQRTKLAKSLRSLAAQLRSIASS